MHRSALLLALVLPLLLASCGGMGGGSGNMGGPTVEERKLKISSEETGSFFYGRRYFVEKTRFWGYLRKPRQQASSSKLVIMREDKITTPDRLPEGGSAGRRYGFDQNYEYKVWGNYTGRKAYDPNSNQILPEFRPTKFEVVDRQPGWLFRQDDRYDPYRITVVPR